MIRRDPIRLFLERERRHGAHLSRALLGPYQRSFREPEAQLRLLGRRATRELGYFNLYARRWWLRALHRRLPRGVLAQGRLFGAPPVFLLTIVDRQQVWKLDIGDSRYSDPTIAAIRQAYARHLRGLDVVGMIDAALYVSARRQLGVDRLIHFHLHALVWNTDEDALRVRCRTINEQIRPLFPYATAAGFERVRRGHLLQVLWYIAKAPYKQYQLHKKENERFHQFKRDINGVNAVRLYAELGRIPLDQITIAGGEGCNVLKRVREQLQRWRGSGSSRPRAAL